MKPSVTTAKNALLLKGAYAEMLKGISPLATNVLVCADDVTEGVEEEGISSPGAVVPVWKALDLVDALITDLEVATGLSVQDSDSPEPKTTVDENAQALVDHLKALSDWATKKARVLAELGDLAMSDTLIAIRDSAFNAAMGIEDTVLSEDDHTDLDEFLITEMQKLSSFLSRESVEMTDFEAEQEIADKMISSMKKLAGIKGPTNDLNE